MTPRRKRMKWFYDRIQSRIYDIGMKWCFLPLGGERRCRGGLLSGIDFSPGERILDLCCGTGGATTSILRRAGAGSRITGLDLSSGQLRAARRRRETRAVSLVEGDAAQLPFRDGGFDKVFITHALHEMPRADRYEVLAEARRVLREWGRVVILEVDDPGSLPLRIFFGFWFFYWLPFNFETPTRRDMLRHGLAQEVKESRFRGTRKTSKSRGILQVVEAER